MKIDRLIGILSLLLQKETETIPSLARQFEVSPRTISRDIETLCRAGIPIMTRQGMNGGLSIMEDYKIDRTLLTSAEMQDILAGLRSLDSVNGTNRYSQLMEKLSAGSSDFISEGHSLLIDLSSWYKDSLAPKIERIRNAIDSHMLIEFTYYSPSSESRRTIEPYYLIFRWSSWYLWGWCHDREDFRLFKLNRMLDLALTGETFQPRPVPTPLTPAHQVYPRTFPAVIRFQSAVRWRLVDEYGLGSVTQEPEGTLLFRWDFADGDELLRWLLTFGDQAELLEPADLRRELGTLAKKISAKYDS